MVAASGGPSSGSAASVADAASVAGAFRLTGLSDALVVDMGGTTSDTARLAKWYSSVPQVTPADLEKVHKGVLKYGQETPASLLYGYGAVEDVYNQLMSPVWLGEKTAAEVLPEVEKQANEAVKKLSQ